MDIGNLVISRRIGESFTVGDHITITIEDIRGAQARVSISCPKSIKILRSELHDRESRYKEPV